MAKNPSGDDINVLEQHIRNLLTPSTPFFFNTLYDPYAPGSDFVRGYPFSMREGVPTAVSHGKAPELSVQVLYCNLRHKGCWISVHLAWKTPCIPSIHLLFFIIDCCQNGSWSVKACVTCFLLVLICFNLSAGLWLNIPDYDAPTQMVKPKERNTKYVNAVMTIPKVNPLKGFSTLVFM